jgi:hypothetical protein
MTTDLTAYQPTTAAPVALRDYQGEAVQRLGEWAASAHAAFTVAQQLVQSSFVPAAFRGKPIEAAAAILAGVEVGLQPMAALRSFDVIQGQAAARAITLRAVVQSHGHEIVLVESTATRCRMRGRRRGSSEWQEVTWTIDRAKELGLTGKENWRKQPIAMLLARATSEIARLIAADAILGIGYSAEEIADGATPDAVATPAEEPQSSTTRRMSRRPQADGGAPAPASTPSDQSQAATDGDAVEDPTDAPPSLITPAQLKALHAALNAAGMSDRDQALAYYAGITGRDVASSKDLTKAEASAVIDALHADAQGEPQAGLWGAP